MILLLKAIEKLESAQGALSLSYNDCFDSHPSPSRVADFSHQRHQLSLSLSVARHSLSSLVFCLVADLGVQI